ncbi:3-oxo-5-alpha-steroid 4-dehydrogenase 1-like [Acanthaster planci]|uniref:3-oxo-5alpha-steroid 4-dehydrogenase (NADP(+)) n=1 Tax=Acanthaster planci TaxID=133434 RepID=A0A8B7YL18_ACAPL|nr:3-oxo-5-alpha-steroid 4-dehydrogenase 1-like [Acanthaster planci]
MSTPAGDPVSLPLTQTLTDMLGMKEEEFLDKVAYCFIFLGAFVSVILQFVGAPYGRYVDSRFGCFIPGKVAWFVQEIPSFLLPTILLIASGGEQGFVNNVLISLMIFHYFQRTFVFTFLIRGGKPTTLLAFLLAFFFCVTNGYLQGQYLTHYAVYPQSWSRDPRFIIGVFLFFSGMAINIHSDSILRNLRKPGETGYKIPHGGMFEYVSGANFFGEAVEWSGFAIACWSLPGLAFAIFTACNIGPRAYRHHWYYKQKFEDYPKSRKAFIPFLL